MASFKMRFVQSDLMVKHKRWKLALILLAATVVHNECLVFWRDWLSWPSINCNSDGCLKMLIIADPQILGPAMEPLSFLGHMDTDR